jgi:hypothetical protein
MEDVIVAVEEFDFDAAIGIGGAGRAIPQRLKPQGFREGYGTAAARVAGVLRVTRCGKRKDADLASRWG